MSVHYDTINVYYKYHKGLCLFAIDWWPRLDGCLCIMIQIRNIATQKCYDFVLCNTRSQYHNSHA